MLRTRGVRVLVLLLALALTLAAVSLLAIASRVLYGQVLTANGPVPGAVVRLRATDNAATTDADGRFTLRVAGLAIHRTVTAWKEGYYIGAADLTGWPRDVEITLKPHTLTDNPGMTWLPSGADPAVELACGNCHKDLHEQWQADAHSEAASNPVVQAMYHGTGADGQPGAGPGFRLDFPDEPGNCAFCHAPAAADLGHLEGEAANGVFCQFCHSIAHAQQPYAETTAGVNAIRLLRPPPGEHLFIGPYDDVAGRDTYNPIQKSSQFCAACHSGSWWNVPTYTSFDEWQASPYAERGVQCQDCHMAATGQTDAEPVRLVSACAPARPGPVLGETLCQLQACIDCHVTGDAKSTDPTTAIALVPARDAADISSHLMPGSHDDDFLRSAVTTTLATTQGSDGVLADVGITNSGAGHHIPTDGWMRNMILLVTATDAEGRELAPLGGQVVPEWGGELAGHPGKGFARVLEDWEGQSPAPPWRNGVRVLTDTRIPALATDNSTYTFAAPADGGPVTVQARLVYRRAFEVWSDAKGWDLPDVVIAEAAAITQPDSGSVLKHGAPAFDTQAFAPSAATTLDGQRLDDSAFVPAAACGTCHENEEAAWSASGHALATTGPFYRAWYKVANQITLGDINPYCAGCHTPIGLLSGQIRSRWGWDSQESFPLNAAANAGVTCDVCHGIAGVTGVGNGAYVLDPSPSAQHAGHPTRPTTPVDHDLLVRPEFCAACHEATHPGSGLPVMTTYSEWQASRFNTGDPATTTTCQDCHFAQGRHGSLHPDDLTQAARIEILPTEAALGGESELQVRVSNVGAGHALPTGSAELRQMWLAVTVTDAAGRVVFESGMADDYGDPGPGSVTYGVRWLDAEGRPTDRLWEAYSVERDHRIPAGGAVVETFHFAVPADASGPLHVQAVLRYRSAAGHLTTLMSVYIEEEIAAPPTIDMAAAEASVPVLGP